jgi:hypothetical protein
MAVGAKRSGLVGCRHRLQPGGGRHLIRVGLCGCRAQNAEAAIAAIDPACSTRRQQMLFI